MDLFSQIEDGVLRLMRGSVELRELRTLETGVRECLFAGDRLTQGFRAEELPAMSVSTSLAPMRSDPATTSEVRCIVPVTVCVVVRAQMRDDARKSALALLWQASRRLDAARRTTDELGANCWVQGDLSSSIVVVEERPFHFAVATVSAEITKVVEL